VAGLVSFQFLYCFLSTFRHRLRLTKEYIGGFCLELSRLYPDFRFIVQDRPPVLEQAKSEFWPIEDPTALEQGRVVLQPHDFFTENPVKNAEVYWLRYIIHDWSDDYCVKILGAIKPSMGPRSRILIW